MKSRTKNDSKSQGAPEGDARVSESSTRGLAALLADDEREIERLHALVAKEAQLSLDRAPTEGRRLLLQKVATTVAPLGRSGAQPMSAMLLDWAEQIESRSKDAPDDGWFLSAFARARKAGVDALLENDAVIDSLRAALAAFRHK